MAKEEGSGFSMGGLLDGFKKKEPEANEDSTRMATPSARRQAPAPAPAPPAARATPTPAPRVTPAPAAEMPAPAAPRRKRSWWLPLFAILAMAAGSGLGLYFLQAAEARQAVPQEASLVIATEPAGATVSVGGTEQASPAVLEGLPPGRVEFEVRAPGYRTQRGHLDLVAGENRVLRLVLTRAGDL